MIVVGAGLAGLVATAELADAGKRVIVLDQEPEQSLGGQASGRSAGCSWSTRPSSAARGIKDSLRAGLAGLARHRRLRPRGGPLAAQWAEAYVDFAAGEKRAWLYEHGRALVAAPGWAERGGYGAIGHGNSVPRFHVTWGTGPGRARAVRPAGAGGARRRASSLPLPAPGGRADRQGRRGRPACAARVLEPSDVAARRPKLAGGRGRVRLGASAVIVTSGGIGGNHDLVRRNWPSGWATARAHDLRGARQHVDGRMLAITEQAGGAGHQPRPDVALPGGGQNWNPVWTGHGIRILPGPPSLWLDARAGACPAPLFPGFDTLGTLAHI